MADEVNVDFYLDPSCGWAWRTSIWIKRVARQRPITVTWKLFSLAVLNSPGDWTRDSPGHKKGFNLERTLALAGRRFGNPAVDRLHVAYGNAFLGSAYYDRPWREMEDLGPEYLALQARCLAAAGLPASLYVEALNDPSTEAEVIADTRTAIETLGAFGVPTIALTGSNVGIFGPVIDPVPSGDAAVALWDSVYFQLQAPYLFEMKRNRIQYLTGILAD